MKINLLPLLFLILIACQQAPKQIQASVQKKTLEDILQQKTKKPADIVLWLKTCSIECRQPDADIAKDLAAGYEELFAIADKTPQYSKLKPEDRQKAMVAQGKIRSAFIRVLKEKNGRDILQTAVQELTNPDSLYASQASEVDELVQKTVDRLKSQPQTRATGFYLQALLIPPLIDNLKLVMSNYRECYLASGKQDKQCLNLYEEMKNYYEKPRCLEGNFNTKLIFSSSADNKVILVAKDLLQSTLEMFGPDPTYRHNEIWFSLKTFSSDKLEKFTNENLKKNVYLQMKIGDRMLTQVKVMQVIKEGQFRMIFNAELDARLAFDQICRKSTPEVLPVELKL